MFTALEAVLLVVYVITLYYTVFWLITFLSYEPHPKREFRQLPKVSVIIPAYNEEDTLQKSALSVLAIDYPRKLLELIIVDDGSTDGTLKLARRIQRANRRQAKVISVENGGKWRAMNSGLAVASGEFVACLDADSRVTANSLKKMLPNFSDDKVAVVLPMLHVDSPRNLLQKVQWHEYVINMFYRKVAGFLNCIHVAPGPFSLYRKSTLDEVGGFRHGHNTEDLEICLRLQSLDYKINQTTEAEAYTEAPSKISELYKQRLRWNLGSTMNILSYRKMLFNPAYGDFGIFQLPIIFLATFLAAIVVVITLYQGVFKPVYGQFLQLKLVNFDLWAYIGTVNIHFNILDVDFFRIFVSASFLLVSLFVLLMAHRSIKKHVVAQGLPAVAVFMSLYYLFLGYIRLIVIKDVILRKKQKW